MPKEWEIKEWLSAANFILTFLCLCFILFSSIAAAASLNSLTLGLEELITNLKKT